MSKTPPKKYLQNINWNLNSNPINFPDTYLPFYSDYKLNLTLPITRYYSVTDTIKIKKPYTLRNLLLSIYKFYQHPLGSKMLKFIKNSDDEDDIFEYVESINKNTKKVDLLGDMTFFEGIKLLEKKGNNLVFILILGS